VEQEFSLPDQKRVNSSFLLVRRGGNRQTPAEVQRDLRLQKMRNTLALEPCSAVRVRLCARPQSLERQLDDRLFLSLCEMAQAVRKRRCSSRELVQAHIARIEQLNSTLNAFVHTDFERACREAEAADVAVRGGTKSSTLGPLHGVPISMKSSIDVGGLPCECGSRLRQDYVPSGDAPLVARLRAAGAIILGNTNVPECLMAWETDNLLYGRTNNPWDLERTPGGSSGGEAAAIASGCSAGGIGSDGGGSIRVPAHYSGICGLKPTPGRVPPIGHFPRSAGPFAQLGVVGPMARTVRDVQSILDVVAGPASGDPCAAPVPLRRWSDAEICSLRIAYLLEHDLAPVTPETAAAVRAAAGALRDQGFEVVEWQPENLDRAWKLWWNLFGRAGQMSFSPMLEGHAAELSPLLREFRNWAMEDGAPSGPELLDTLLERDVLRGRFLEKMDEFPILLCPVCSIPAFRHGEREWSVQGRKVTYLKAMAYAQWFNLLGTPAVVVPVARSSEGLPIGVQIVGRPWEEEAVLALAAKIEDACGGFCPPPL
jgi:Asp-tRNA(Asn)/Glu-tRNA(Gln) amidotransferase A subunit family amidase